MNSPESANNQTAQDLDLNAQVEQFSQMANAACESATEFVRQNPIACTVAAVGVGVGIGLLVSKVAKNSNVLETVLSNEDLNNQVLGMLAKSLPQILDNQFRN